MTSWNNSSAFVITPAHSKRTWPSAASLAVASSYAYLRAHEPRSENPGVGGSIPFQPTISFQTLARHFAAATSGDSILGPMCANYLP